MSPDRTEYFAQVERDGLRFASTILSRQTLPPMVLRVAAGFVERILRYVHEAVNAERCPNCKVPAWMSCEACYVRRHDRAFSGALADRRGRVQEK